MGQAVEANRVGTTAKTFFKREKGKSGEEGEGKKGAREDPRPLLLIASQRRMHTLTLHKGTC